MYTWLGARPVLWAAAGEGPEVRAPALLGCSFISLLSGKGRRSIPLLVY